MTEQYVPLRYVSGSETYTVGDPRYSLGGGGESPYAIFDADYTGASDVSAAFQSAITAAASTGQVIFLKPGILRLDSSVRPVSGTRIVGSGMKKTIIKPTGPVPAFYRVNDGTFTDVSFEHFEVDGSAQTTTGGNEVSLKAFYFTHCRRLYLNDVWVHDTGATGIGIDHITGTITNCWATGCGRLGTSTSPGSSGIGIGVGRLEADWEPLTISNCHTHGNMRYGIFLESQTAGLTPSGITIMGCTARANKDGFGDCGGLGTRWVANHAYQNTRAGFAFDKGTLSAGTIPAEVTMSDCWSKANQYGLIVSGSNGGDHFDDARIQGNHFLDNTSDGIRLGVTSSGSSVGSVITGNTIAGNGGYGLRVGIAPSITYVDLAVTNNRFSGNTSGDVYISAPTTGLILTGNDVRAAGAEVTVAPTAPGTTAGNYGTVTVAP